MEQQQQQSAPGTKSGDSNPSDFGRHQWQPSQDGQQQQQQQQHKAQAPIETDWRQVSPAANVEREFLAQHIEVMLRNKRPNAPADMLQRLHSLARRLEKVLYLQARSKAEYSNRFTLDQRIHSAVQRTASAGAASRNCNTSGSSGGAAAAAASQRLQVEQRRQQLGLDSSSNTKSLVERGKLMCTLPSPSFAASHNSIGSPLTSPNAHYRYQHIRGALLEDVRMGKRRRQSSSMSDGESSSGRGQRKRAMAFHCQYEVSTRSLNAGGVGFGAGSGGGGHAGASGAVSPSQSSVGGQSNSSDAAGKNSGTVVFSFSGPGGNCSDDSSGESDDDSGDLGGSHGSDSSEGTCDGIADASDNDNDDNGELGEGAYKATGWGKRAGGRRTRRHRGTIAGGGGVRRKRRNAHVTRCYQVLDLLFSGFERVNAELGMHSISSTSSSSRRRSGSSCDVPVPSRRELVRELHEMHASGNPKFHVKMSEAIAYAITQHAIDVTQAQFMAPTPFASNNNNVTCNSNSSSSMNSSSSSHGGATSLAHQTSQSAAAAVPCTSSSPASPPAPRIVVGNSARVKAAMASAPTVDLSSPAMDLSSGYSDDDEDNDDDDSDSNTSDSDGAQVRSVAHAAAVASAAASAVTSPRESLIPRISIRRPRGGHGAGFSGRHLGSDSRSSGGVGGNGVDMAVVDDFVPKVRADDIEARFPNSYHAATDAAASDVPAIGQPRGGDESSRIGGGVHHNNNNNAAALLVSSDPKQATTTAAAAASPTDDNAAEPLSLLLNFCGERFTRRPIPHRLLNTILLLFRPPPPEYELKGIDPPPFDMRCLRRCVDRFILAEPTCASVVAARLLRSWPQFDSGYQILYLRQLESLFRLCDAVTGAALITPVVRRLARCALHGNCHVAMTAIALAEKFLGFAQHLPSDALGSTSATSEARQAFVLLQRLLKSNQSHWNKTVVQASVALSQKLRTALCSQATKQTDAEW